jgi:hypothetical protein
MAKLLFDNLFKFPIPKDQEAIVTTKHNNLGIELSHDQNGIVSGIYSNRLIVFEVLKGPNPNCAIP